MTLAVLHCQRRFACRRRAVSLAVLRQHKSGAIELVEVHDKGWSKHAPTERLPRMAIFRCFTVGAMLLPATRVAGESWNGQNDMLEAPPMRIGTVCDTDA